MSSFVVEYRRSYTSESLIDDTMYFDPNLLFDTRSKRSIRVLRASVSSRIPNISSNYGNNIVRISNDGGATWTSISLSTGVYSIQYLEAAINSIASGLAWYTSVSDPAIRIQYNLATNFVYTTLDSTKLVGGVGQIAIDYTQSAIYEFLGYASTTTLLVDGVHAATSEAQVDWIGSDIIVILRGIGGLSYVNGTLSQQLCLIPLENDGSSVPTSYTYPHDALEAPEINCAIPDRLSSIRFEFIGTRSTGATPRKLYIQDGSVIVQLLFMTS